MPSCLALGASMNTGSRTMNASSIITPACTLVALWLLLGPPSGVAAVEYGRGWMGVIPANFSDAPKEEQRLPLPKDFSCEVGQTSTTIIHRCGPGFAGSSAAPASKAAPGRLPHDVRQQLAEHCQQPGIRGGAGASGQVTGAETLTSTFRHYLQSIKELYAQIDIDLAVWNETGVTLQHRIAWWEVRSGGCGGPRMRPTMQSRSGGTETQPVPDARHQTTLCAALV